MAEASVAVKRKPSAKGVKRRSNRPLVASPLAQPVYGNQAKSVIQAKLTIGQPNDKYEQEADRVADQVMRMPDADVAQRVESGTVQPMRIQRLCPECEEEVAQRQPMEEEEELLQPKKLPGHTPKGAPNLESRINNLKSGGQPLDFATRSFFEPRFGHDFSNVRIHTDSSSAGTAKSINARAFTLGNHVVMGAGEYQPSSQSGHRLLGHELTHVVQQGGRGNSDRVFEPHHRKQSDHPFDEEGGILLTTPAFQLNSPLIQMVQDENPCNKYIPHELTTNEDVAEALDRTAERVSLERSYTTKTIYELLTTKRDDEKGSNDPLTIFLQSIYSPADEAEKIGDLYDGYPALKSACKNAFVRQTEGAISECVSQLMDAKDNIPATSPDLPKIPKDLTVKEVKETIVYWVGVYNKNYADSFDSNKEGRCTPELQAKSTIGKVISHNYFFNKVQFIGTKGAVVEAQYTDVSEWITIDGVDYIAFNDLLSVEAKLAARKK